MPLGFSSRSALTYWSSMRYVAPLTRTASLTLHGLARQILRRFDANCQADIAHLPEILTRIGSILAPPDLLGCVQVCRLWNEIFISHLYHTIDDSKYSWPAIMSEYDSEDAVGKKDEEWIRTVFAKYGHLVRHFSVSWTLLIDCAFDDGTFTRLNSISTSFIGMNQSMRKQRELRRRVSLTENEGGAQGVLLSPLFAGALIPTSVGWSALREQKQNWETMQKFFMLVTHNPGLKQLQLDRTLKNLASIQDIEFIYQILSTLSELTTFENSFLALDLSRLLNSVPRLHTLGFAEESNHHNLLLTTPHPQLRSLNVDNFVESRTFFTLLGNLPNLDRLSFHGFNNYSEFCLDGPAILNNTSSKLQVLRFHSQTSSKDQYIAEQVLPWLPNLTEFRIDVLTTAIAQALVRYCPLLEIFEAANDESLHEDYTNRPTETDTASILFSGCPRLKIFDGIHHEIDAEKIITLPFVCQELVVFRCQIRGVPRLTPAEQISVTVQESSLTTLREEQEAALRKQEQSRDVQQRVLDRLASLTHLRTVDLGFEYRDLDIFFGHGSSGRKKAAQEDYDYGSPFLDTLELSLDSGLDHLGALTKLEVFGFESLNHRIGRAELAWMAAHWPRLRVIRGIHVDKKMLRVKRSVDNYKEELRTYMRTLRSDIVHEAVEV
ncbi:hypothetical protein BG015_001129 [Linnemannia schmuckeri]|uniref:F-box domain-containing protein n=1 Tax=Linnemannia schmuckeri TaxID=64567 RepID=A0A9P5VFP7_9FUNG|nr:hypothetical protein BG015_001129 [Linnemannia schmuckeri]